MKSPFCHSGLDLEANNNPPNPDSVLGRNYDIDTEAGTYMVKQ
jgi:hypothetical protein